MDNTVSKFVTIDIMGGLGNQMFQLATLYNYSQKTGRRMIVKKLDRSPSVTARSTYWNTFLKRFGDLVVDIHMDDLPGRKITIQEKAFDYGEIEYNTTDTVVKLSGYFQCEKYFESIRSQLIDLFRPSDPEINILRATYKDLLSQIDSVCVIHVRRSDYLNLQHCHRVLDMDWYRSAIEYMYANHKVNQCIIFTDDHEWVKLNFNSKTCTIIRDTDYMELFLMTHFKYFIIANSSFSWWGAWLSTVQDKVIVSPKRWFNQGGPAKHSLNCDNWITL